MASRIHFFKLLEECHNDLFIKIPETIIFGFGFENVTYVHNTETGTLIFKTITFASLHGITNHWILKNGISKLIIKTREGNKIIESNEGIMDYVTVECIIQEFLEQDQLFSNNKVSWDYQMGHSMHVASKFKHVKTETSNSTSHIESSKDLILLNRKVMCPIKLRRIVDAFRSKINEKLKLIYSSLEYLELDFLKSDKQEYYCLGIGKYTYSENKSLQRFANSKNSSLCKSPSSSSTKNPYSPLCSEVSSLRPVSELPSYAPSLDDNIRALISPKGGYRFMRYNYWKTKIDNGEKLLPNELKYAKNIASHSTRILIETSKNLADVKGMIKKLKGSFERKNKQGLFQTKLKTEINDLILRERERAKTRLEQQVWKMEASKHLPAIVSNAARNDLKQYSELLDKALKSAKKRE